MSEDEKAIRELVAAWMEASRTGDTDTVLSLMAADVVFMVPGREPFGKEEFAAAARGMTDLRIEGASDIQEIEVFGDWAYLRNRLTITMTPAGGEAMLRRSGYTLSILRKEKDGR
ncbi:MAG: YybH family protein, partial [Methyloceanibacter sp.]